MHDNQRAVIRIAESRTLASAPGSTPAPLTQRRPAALSWPFTASSQPGSPAARQVIPPGGPVGLWPRLAWATLVLGLASGLLGADTGADKARKALSVLQSEASPADKAFACKQLAIWGGPEAVPALAPLLADEQLASWARIALEAIPGPAADAALREAAQRLTGLRLVGVINSIGVRADCQAIDLLRAKLTNADPEVASAAAVALGRIGGQEAARALTAALANVPDPVRSAVAQGAILCAERFLAEGQAAQAQALYDALRHAPVPKPRLLEATRGAILARQADGLSLLLETLRALDKDLFRIGLRAARELPGQAVTEALAAELERTPPARQPALLLALADRTDAAVLPALAAATRSGSRDLRLAALSVLEQKGDVTCVPVLLEAAVSTDAEVASSAKAALRRLPAGEVDADLATRLRQATGPTRQLLVELAGQRRIGAAVPELIKATDRAELPLRLAAIKALGETASIAELEVLTGLLARAKDQQELETVESALESACARLPDKAVCTDKLLARLPACATPARCAILRLLGSLATAPALAAVQTALASPEPTEQETAFRVLADWPEATALPALVDFYSRSTNATQRALALRGCVRLLSLASQPVAQTLKIYAQLVQRATGPDDRRLVLSGLAKVPDPAALKLVEPMLADPAIEAEAEQALLGIASGIVGLAPTEARALAARLKAQSKYAATRARANDLLETLDQVEDYIVAWQVAGPYTEPESGRSLFDTAFPPEKAGAAVSWKPLPAATQPKRPWMLDLLAALGGERRAAYARTFVWSESERPARVEFGTDDGYKLWWNGQLVQQANRSGAAVPGQFKANVTLRQGWNEVLLKVTQDTGPWEFCLRLRSPSGEKLEGIRQQATPPQPTSP